MFILKVKLPQRKDLPITDYEKVADLIGYLHRKKGDSKFALLFPELKTGKFKDFGNYVLIYFNDEKFLNKTKRYLNRNGFSYTEIQKGIAPKGLAVSVKKNFIKKATPGYVRYVLANPQKNKKFLDKLIWDLHNAGISTENIVKILKEKVRKKYPYIVYHSKSLGKRGIYNHTIIEVDAVFLEGENGELSKNLEEFNNYGLLKSEYLKKIWLPVF